METRVLLKFVLLFVLFQLRKQHKYSEKIDEPIT